MWWGRKVWVVGALGPHRSPVTSSWTESESPGVSPHLSLSAAVRGEYERPRKGDGLWESAPPGKRHSSHSRRCYRQVHEDEILNVLRVVTSGHESIKSRVVGGGKEEEVVSCMRECQEQMRQDSQIYLCVFQPLYRLSLILREEGLHFGWIPFPFLSNQCCSASQEHMLTAPLFHQKWKDSALHAYRGVFQAGTADVNNSCILSFQDAWVPINLPLSLCLGTLTSMYKIILSSWLNSFCNYTQM